MTKHLNLITAEHQEEWQEILDQVLTYDFYHLPGYHLLGKKQDQPVMIVYREGNMLAALPLILRNITNISGLEGCQYKDATSVYGYPGPLFNRFGAQDCKFIHRFHQAITSFALEHNIVTVFSRLHPLLENHRGLQGIGTVTALSRTVSIDLSLETDNQFAQYRKSHRYEVRRARRDGMIAYHAQDWSAYDKFIHLYTQTMKRVNAAPQYFFDQDFFDNLKFVLKDHLHLFVAELDGNVCAASLFVRTGNIIQYHLSGSDENYSKWAPTKLIIDEARLWGKQAGAHYLHLGGGVGSNNDSLFELKAGFSPAQHTFYIWQWKVQNKVYDELINARADWLEKNGKKLIGKDFFPLYRA